MILPRKEHYGFRELITSPVIIDGHPFVTPDQDHYDCVDAAVNLNDIYRKQGLRTEVWEGVDEFMIWDSHYFLKAPHIIDPTPPFRITGSNHMPRRKLTEAQIEQTKTRLVPLDQGMIPLRFSPPYLSAVSVKRYMLIRFENQRPTMRYDLLLPTMEEKGYVHMMCWMPFDVEMREEASQDLEQVVEMLRKIQDAKNR